MFLTTENVLAEPRPEAGKQKILRDSEVKGFGVRLTSGSVSWIAEGKCNGQAKRVTLGSFAEMTPEQAREEARIVLAKMSAKFMTLGESLESYVTTRVMRPATAYNYRFNVNKHLSDWLDLPCNEITAEMVVQRQQELGKRLAGPYCNKIMETLRALLYHAGIEDNPVRILARNRMWYIRTRRQSVIPDHKLEVWYRAVMLTRGNNIRDYLLLLITSGLRSNEARTLSWQEVDFDQRVLRVKSSIAKNGREHVLPLTQFQFELLSRRKAESKSQWVFPGMRDKPMSGALHAVDGIAMQCGFRFMIHDLRRVFVSTAARLNVPHYLTKRLVNHIGFRDDTREYIVTSTEQLRSYMELIGNHLLDAMGADPAYWNHGNFFRKSYAPLTLGDAVDKYTNRKDLARETIRTMRVTLETRLDDWLWMPITSITPQMVERRYEYIAKIGFPLKASQHMANQTMTFLNVVLNWVMKTHEVDGKPLLKSNPVLPLRLTGKWVVFPLKTKTIPEERLADWYRGVMTLTATPTPDLLLLVLFTGLSHASAIKLTWSDIDLEKRELIAAEKKNRKHVLPLSDFVFELLRRRKEASKSSYVFPGRGSYITQYHWALERVWERSGVVFTVTDLRRTFLAVAEKLSIPWYAARAFCNRSDRRNQAMEHKQYDVELLREPMQRIADRLMELMQVEKSSLDKDLREARIASDNIYNVG